jgi:uncharacterized protein
MNKSFALVTGASMGIGKNLALECARRNRNVLLTALEEPLLIALAEALQRDFGVTADYLAVDLAAADGPQKVYDWCMAKGYQVNMLLSNAGIGMGGMFEKNNLETYRTMLRLNNQAAFELTYFFLPMLKAQPEAHILYTSSMEGTLPIPYKAAYTGTKHFLYGFSLALREELRPFGVHVSVLCPGPVPTHAGSIARMKSQGKIAQLMSELPEDVARKGINGLLAQKQVIVPGLLPTILERLTRLLPRGFKMRLMSKAFSSFAEIQQ